jgi:ABC-2 type transport system ATP-binding protein
MNITSNIAANFALEALGVSVSYRDTPVLRELDLQVRPGEIYALLGGNGAGKSTTINAMLGFVRPSAGAVRVCGIDVGADPLGARAKLAYVPENVALYEHLSARENLEYFLRLAGNPAVRADVEVALDAVMLERDARGQRLGGYSKGMRQKVAIALALARSVPVLLLDEPTSGLDPHASREFNQLLQSLRTMQVTVFMVTHDLMGAAEVADRIGFLDRGHIAGQFEASGSERFNVNDLYRRYAEARKAA